MPETTASTLSCRETHHSMPDGARIFARTLEPEGRPLGSVLIVHGFGEHSGRYIHVMERLAQAGLRAVAMDLRGHGRSDGRRGDIKRYGIFFDDIAEIWKSVSAGGVPAFLYGHSLGGQIVLNFAAERRTGAAGLVATSPWLELAFVPPGWKRALARLAAKVWPSFTQRTDMVPERLSRDLEFLRAMRDLHLVHHRMSARLYYEITSAARRAAEEAPRFEFPVLLVHGDHDPVTSMAATERLYTRMDSQDKTLVIVPGALHETHNDLCREEILGTITTWLLAHCHSHSGAAGAPTASASAAGL